MVMSKVTLNVSAPASVPPQNPTSDNSFSDVLGGVNSERKQAGMKGSSDTSGGKDTEFRYTEQRSGSGNGQGQNVQKQDNSPAKNDYGNVDSGTVDAADKMLKEAVAQLRKTISESEEDDEFDIVKLLMELLAKKKRQASEADDTDEMSAAELLMAMLMNAANGDEANEPVMTAMPVAEVTAVSDTSDEAAMLTSHFGLSTEETEQIPETAQNVDETALETAEEKVSFAEQLIPEEAVEEVVTTEVAPETIEAVVTEASADDNVPTDEAKLIPDEEPITDEKPIAETVTVKADSALEKLNDILSKAKDELNLVRAEIKTVTDTNVETQAVEAIKPQETAVKFGSDKVDELNSILNGDKEAPVKEETENTVHTETDNAVHMAAQLIDRNEIADSRIAEQPVETEAVQRPPEVQTADEILSRIQNMEGDRTEFTMVLNPESLGRITVKLVMTGEKVALDISAENPETRQLLESRSENLQSMLRTNGVELESYKVVTAEEETNELMQQESYDGSSKNPYGRQQQGQDSNDDDDSSSFYDLLQSI